MKKTILLFCFGFFFNFALNAQYLAGFTVQGFTKVDLQTGVSTLLIPYPDTYYDYQGSTTTDYNSRYFRFAKAIYPGNPDTLITIDLSDLSVQKDTFSSLNEKGDGDLLYMPEFYQEKIYGLSPKGLMSYDLTTKVYSLVSDEISLNTVGFYSGNSSFNTAQGIYYFFKNSTPTNIEDTLFSYNINTNIFSKKALPLANSGASFLYDYLPKEGVFLIIGALGGTTSTNGIFKYDPVTESTTLVNSWNFSPIVAQNVTVDTVNSRYFVRTAGNNVNIQDTIMCYDYVNNIRQMIPVSRDYINFEYIYKPNGTGISNHDWEPLQISIAPNPVQNTLHIQLQEQQNELIKSIKITDLLGAQKYVRSNINRKSVSVSFSGFSSGNYMVNIETTKGKSISKLISKR